MSWLFQPLQLSSCQPLVMVCVKCRLQRSWKEQTMCDVLAQLFHSITMIWDVAIYVVLNHGMIRWQWCFCWRCDAGCVTRIFGTKDLHKKKLHVLVFSFLSWLWSLSFNRLEVQSNDVQSQIMQQKAATLKSWELIKTISEVEWIMGANAISYLFKNTGVFIQRVWVRV